MRERVVTRTGIAGAFAAAALLAVVVADSQRHMAEAATFTVTTTADSGPGSLREAISDANANAGVDAIGFDIAPGGIQTIALLSVLPTITDPVIIDGTTQPGFAGTPIIELTGTSAGVGACGAAK